MDTQFNYDINMIKKLPIFNELDEKVIVDILSLDERIIKIVRYKPGENLIMEKRFDRKMFLMMKGKVEISKDVISKDKKSNKAIKTLEGSGHYIGEITALTGKPRTASVTAVEQTICLVIDLALLMYSSSELLEQLKSKFYPRLFELLCQRLRETDECVVNQKQRIEELEKRVIEVLKQKRLQHDYYEKELRKKRTQIKHLEEKLEQFGYFGS
jgi:CRP/FNR family transcriptional regulator, cyclic AMP receptor protein